MLNQLFFFCQRADIFSWIYSNDTILAIKIYRVWFLSLVYLHSFTWILLYKIKWKFRNIQFNQHDFLDRHYVWRSHDPTFVNLCPFFKGLIVFHLPLYMDFFVSVSFFRVFFSALFFSNYFMEQLRRTRTDSALVLPVLTV